MNTADKVRQKRAELDLTQMQLAGRAGVNVRTIARLESGEGGVSTETMFKLATALMVDVNYLYDTYDAAWENLKGGSALVDGEKLKAIRLRDKRGELSIASELGWSLEAIRGIERGPIEVSRDGLAGLERVYHAPRNEFVHQRKTLDEWRAELGSGFTVEQRRTCSICGHVNTQEGGQCSNCGQHLTPWRIITVLARTEPATTTTGDGSSREVLIGRIVGALCGYDEVKLAMVLGYMHSLDNPQQQETEEHPQKYIGKVS